VYLRPVQRADIDQVQVRPLLPCPTCAATIDEQAIVRNVTGAPQTVRLTGSYGGVGLNFGSATIAPGATWTAAPRGDRVTRACGRPGSPTLYKATLTLSGRQAGVTSAATRPTAGSAASRVTAAAGSSSTAGCSTCAGSTCTSRHRAPAPRSDVAQMEQLIGWVKQLGATIIRAHYPLDPELEEMADRGRDPALVGGPRLPGAGPVPRSQPAWRPGRWRC
jgi:beta-glucuronidase